MSEFDRVYEEAKYRLEANKWSTVFIYAWPEVFSSTAGPRPGIIGGAMMTPMQVFAFEYEDGEKREVRGTVWCAGVWKKWDRAKDGLKWPKT